MNNSRMGSSFEGFLDEEGLHETQDLARKRVIAWQVEEEKKRSGIERGNGGADEHEPRPPNS